MDRLVAMQTFVRVAELGSFSKAAEGLKLPNATVSTRIAQLEAEIARVKAHRDKAAAHRAAADALFGGPKAGAG